MTYSETWIEEALATRYEGEASSTEAGPTLAGLLRPRVGVHELTRWADARGLTVDYVDHTWIRVPVTASQALEFLAGVSEVGDETFTGNRE